MGGEVDSDTGMVLNMATLDEVVQNRVVERFDHTNLNLDPLFVIQVPTTENLCREIFGILNKSLPEIDLEYVRVEETENNFFQFYGE